MWLFKFFTGGKSPENMIKEVSDAWERRCWETIDKWIATADELNNTRVQLYAAKEKIKELKNDRKWNPIKTAASCRKLWVYHPHCEPQQFVAWKSEKDNGQWYKEEKIDRDDLNPISEPTHWVDIMPEPKSSL